MFPRLHIYIKYYSTSYSTLNNFPVTFIKSINHPSVTNSGTLLCPSNVSRIYNTKFSLESSRSVFLRLFFSQDFQFLRYNNRIFRFFNFHFPFISLFTFDVITLPISSKCSAINTCNFFNTILRFTFPIQFKCVL